MHPLTARSDRARPSTFDQWLEPLLEQARWRHDALTRIWQLYDLNKASQVLEARVGVRPDFADLTVQSPRVDRNNPLDLFPAPLDEPPVEP
ncbi:MAG: hypothetical protein J0L52_12730 [Caulobacterales bacterium]|nr:hypothetical protein [Caulobacterales bacterium]